MTIPPDPSLDFDRFVVGLPNRVAAAAAVRVAEAPGRAYNPLIVSGPAGTGKTHLLTAIGRRARALDGELLVHYETGADLVDRISDALADGTLPEVRRAVAGMDLFLLDGLDDLADAEHSQGVLAEVFASLLARGAQLVVTGRRAAEEISTLAHPLLEVLAGGLTVEVGVPDAEMRAAIVEGRGAERGLALERELVRALAAIPFHDVRELTAALDRLVAVAELEGRAPVPGDLADLAGMPGGVVEEEDEFDDFLSDISTAVAAVVETAPWRRRLAEAILRWEGEGIRTRRLEAALDADTAPDVDALLGGFGRDVGRLRRIARELPAGVAADPQLLRDPDRLHEAERLLAEQARSEGPAAAAPAAATIRPAGQVDRWYLDREKVAWDWMALDDRLVEEQR